jgi:hypothetical protein
VIFLKIPFVHIAEIRFQTHHIKCGKKIENAQQSIKQELMKIDMFYDVLNKEKIKSCYSDRIVVTDNYLLFKEVYGLYDDESYLDLKEKRNRGFYNSYRLLLLVKSVHSQLKQDSGDLIISTYYERVLVDNLPKNVAELASSELKTYIDSHKNILQTFIKKNLENFPIGGYPLFQIVNLLCDMSENANNWRLPEKLILDILQKIFFELNEKTDKLAYDPINEVLFVMEDNKAKFERLEESKEKIIQVLNNLSTGDRISIIELVNNILKNRVTYEECENLIIEIKNAGKLPEGEFDQVRQLFVKKEEIGFHKSLEDVCGCF